MLSSWLACGVREGPRAQTRSTTRPPSDPPRRSAYKGGRRRQKRIAIINSTLFGAACTWLDLSRAARPTGRLAGRHWLRGFGERAMRRETFIELRFLPYKRTNGTRAL